MTLTNEVLKEYINTFVVSYLDGLVDYSRTQQQRSQHLRLLPEILRQEKLYANPSKCTFDAGSVQYLGRYLTSDGVSVDPQRVKGNRDYSTSIVKVQVQLFLGLVRYYKRLIQNCSKFANHLTVPIRSVPLK